MVELQTLSDDLTASNGQSESGVVIETVNNKQRERKRKYIRSESDIVHRHFESDLTKHCVFGRRSSSRHQLVAEGEVIGVQLVEDVLKSLESECKFEHKSYGGIWTAVLVMEWTECIDAESEHTEWFGV